MNNNSWYFTACCFVNNLNSSSLCYDSFILFNLLLDRQLKTIKSTWMGKALKKIFQGQWRSFCIKLCWIRSLKFKYPNFKIAILLMQISLAKKIEQWTGTYEFVFNPNFQKTVTDICPSRDTIWLISWKYKFIFFQELLNRSMARKGRNSKNYF